MARFQRKPLSLLDIFFTLTIDPRGVLTRAFYVHGIPPYILPTICLFILVCLLPPLITAPDALENPQHVILVKGIMFTSLLTILLTSALLASSVKLLHSTAKTLQVVSLLIYALAPLTTVMALLYGLNKIFQGELTILTFILTGYARSSDFMVMLYPFAIRIAALLSLYTISHGLAIIVQLTNLLGLFIGILALPLLLGSFIISLYITEIIYPNVTPQITSFFYGFMQWPN
jgi:hypothetical protein